MVRLRYVVSPSRDVEADHDVSRVRLELPTTLSVYSVINGVTEPGGVFQQQLHPCRELQLFETSRVDMFSSAIREERGECGRKIGGVTIVAQDIGAGDDIDRDFRNRITST